MLRVIDLENALKFDSGNFITELCEYPSDANVFNAIEEIADLHFANSWISWYEFAGDNVEAVNDVITKIGWNALGKNIENAAKMAQFFVIKEELLDCVEDGLKFYAINYYRSLYGYEDDFMPHDLWKSLCEVISGIPEKFSEITDVIDNYNMEITWQ